MDKRTKGTGSAARIVKDALLSDATSTARITATHAEIQMQLVILNSIVITSTLCPITRGEKQCG